MRRILMGAGAGFVALALWTIVANGLLGVANRLEMNPVEDERGLYQALKSSISEPGVYLVNPALTEQWRYPDAEPVFTVSYSGVGHEAAGRMLVLDLLIALASSVLVAGLLSFASEHVLSGYLRRVVYVTAIGLLLAVSDDLARCGIGGYPAGAAIALAASHLVSWVLAGLAMAWVLRGPTAATGSR